MTALSRLSSWWSRPAGASTIEPTQAAENSWGAHVKELADATLFTQTDSWYMGSNIAGKPRRLLSYIGGVGQYRDKCDEVARNGYSGFVMQ